MLLKLLGRKRTKEEKAIKMIEEGKASEIDYVLALKHENVFKALIDKVNCRKKGTFFYDGNTSAVVLLGRILDDWHSSPKVRALNLSEKRKEKIFNEIYDAFTALLSNKYWYRELSSEIAGSKLWHFAGDRRDGLKIYRIKHGVIWHMLEYLEIFHISANDQLREALFCSFRRIMSNCSKEARTDYVDFLSSNLKWFSQSRSCAAEIMKEMIETGAAYEAGTTES